jgi:hypothetical protein
LAADAGLQPSSNAAATASDVRIGLIITLIFGSAGKSANLLICW